AEPVVTIPAGLAGAVAIMTVLGFAFSVGGIATQTLLQVGIPDNLRGRVMSLYGLIFRGGPAVGALAMGTLGDWVGMAWPLAVGGLLAMVAVALCLPRRARMAAALEVEAQPAAK
ncbi:MAG: MFS transporter, partial [Alphaproteobacteria bacterium]